MRYFLGFYEAFEEGLRTSEGLRGRFDGFQREFKSFSGVSRF